MSILDVLNTSSIYTQPKLPADDAAAYLQNLFAGIVAAARALSEMQRSGRLDPSSFARGRERAQTGKHGLPSDYSARALPQVSGDSEGLKGVQLAGHGKCRGGELDLMRLLTERLFSACPDKPRTEVVPADGAPSDAVADGSSGGAPNIDATCEAPPEATCDAPTEGEPPVDACAPTDPAPEGEPEANAKVFVVGDLVHFGRGDGTVRSGLEQLLDAATNPKKKGRLKVDMPAEDVDRLRKLLASDDPEAKATLATKVPKKQSLVIGEDGRILSTVDTRSKIMGNASLGVAQHTGSRIDRSVGGQLELDGKTYDVAGTELHSPIKIALDGKDAKLDGNHGFRIDLNGFRERGGEIRTSGGLNGNEAWLVRDREGNGVVKNGVVDGNDVYGDHQGRRKDGYDDLARDFAREVKTDPKTGRRYIDLTAPGSKAARELKLLDAHGQLRAAKDVLTRIEVDGARVDERDAKGNVITARGEVTYKDGRTATSADQWFKAV